MTHNDTAGKRRRGKWQFSLRGLMFSTTVVCLCAGLIGVAPLVAIVVLPLVVAALVRTARVNTRPSADQHSLPNRGLWASFCQSLAIVVSLVVVVAAVLFAAVLAGTLILTGVTLRIAKPAVRVLGRVGLFAWGLARSGWRRIRPAEVRVKLVATLDWARARVVDGTARLAMISQRLLRAWWSPTTCRAQK